LFGALTVQEFVPFSVVQVS